MTDRALSAIVLAAGEGTRMRSSLAKPLHPLCGRPMVNHVLAALRAAGVDRVVVVVGFKAADVRKAVEAEVTPELAVIFADQREQRGTGDAAAAGLTGLDPLGEDDEEDVLVLPGDTPLVRGATLSELVRLHRTKGDAVTLLSAVMDDPMGYGRIVRSATGGVTAIVEQTDLATEQQQIREVGTSIYCFNRALLASGLLQISPVNAQGEYYLTDVIGVLAKEGSGIGSFIVDDPSEVAGVNDRQQLARAEEVLRARIAAERPSKS